MGDPASCKEAVHTPNRGARRSRQWVPWVWFVGSEKRTLAEYIEGERGRPLPEEDRPRIHLTAEARYRLDILPNTFREFQSMAVQSTAAA